MNVDSIRVNSKNIANLFKSTIKDKLIDLLNKFLKNTYKKEELIKILKQELSDREYFEIFCKEYYKKIYRFR